MSLRRPLAVGTLCAAFPLLSLTAASQNNDVEWDGIFSDTTRNFVSPAEIKGGDTATFKLRAKANDLTGVTARFWISGPNTEQRLAMSKTGTVDSFDYWSVSMTVPSSATAIYYRFEVTDGSDTDYYDAGAPTDAWSVRGMSDSYRGDDYNFYIPVGFKTPEWSKDAIVYQIFPDRFYDGDPSNSRQYPEDCFWYLDYAPASSGASECAGYTVPPPPSGYTKYCEFHDSWNEVPNQGPCDFYGGDLKGIGAKSSYLKSLGVTTLYLNPIFRSVSNHKYDTMDWTSVDPRFGGNQALSQLVDTASREQFKLILDGVFNHASDIGMQYNGWLNYSYDNGTAGGFDAYSSSCGAWEEVFLNAYGTNWQDCASQYTDWFKVWNGTDTWDVDRDGNKTEPAAHNCGWYGFEFMPDIDYRSPSNPNSEPRVWLYGGTSASNLTTAKSSIAGKWIDTGIDGWRLDVPDNAGYFNNSTAGDCSKSANDLTLWQGFRTAVKTVDTDAYIVGELWADASSNSGVSYVQGVFDGTMNYYYFGMPMSCFITDLGVHNDANECTDAYASLKGSSSTSVESLDKHLAKERRVYPASFYQSSWNILSSHDTARFMSRAGNDFDKLEEAFYFMATLPGAPVVYYGDELGVAGANNELGRAPFPWSDLSNPGTPAMQLHDLVADLMCVRSSYAALRTGSFITIHVSNSQKTYGYGRFDSTDRIAVAINNDGTSHSVSLDVSRMGIANASTMTDVLSQTEYSVANGALSVNVPAHSGVILVTSDRLGASSACFTVPVEDLPPEVNAGDDFTVTTEDDILLNGSGTDPDGDTITYVWTDEYKNVVGNAARVTLSPIATPGTYTFTLTGTSNDLSDSDMVVVTVEESGGNTCQQRTYHTPFKLGAFLMPLLMSGLAFSVLRRRRS